MDGGGSINLQEALVVGMAIFNLLLWGPIGFTVRRVLREYDLHKDDISKKVGELEQRHNNLRAELPEKYVSAARFDAHMDRVEEMFRLILNKLENKADKK